MIFSALMDEEVDDHSFSKNPELVESDKENGFAPATSFDIRLHFTVPSERQKRLMTEQCST